MHRAPINTQDFNPQGSTCSVDNKKCHRFYGLQDAITSSDLGIEWTDLFLIVIRLA